jgi:hypothetical protein
MAAKMAAENMNLIYLSSAFRYTKTNEVSSHKYEVDDKEFGHVKINNNSCLFCKMVANIAAKAKY